MAAPWGPVDVDGDEFTELVDADFGRVDLVDKAANGTQFLISKAAASALTSFDSPGPRRAHDMPLPSTYPRRLKATGYPQVRMFKAVTSKKEQIAVYDQSGRLLGTCDPGDVTELQQSGTDPQAAKVQAQHAQPDPAAQAAAEVTKALSQSLHSVRPRQPGEVRKSAATLNDQYNQLLKSLTDSQVSAVKMTVADAALKIIMGGVADSAKAVTIAKRAACQYAVDKKLI